MFHWADGTCIECPGCHETKMSTDPSFPETSRWWQLHGRPSEPGSLSNICCYCETGWRKKRPDLTQQQYIEWVNTEEGKATNTSWTASIVEIRIARGPNPRFSKKQIDSWGSAPVTLTRQSANNTEIIEPEEEFILASDYVAAHQRAPENDGVQCEWVTRRNGERQYGFWKTTAAPLRRRHKTVESLKIDEVLDDGEMMISEDQVSNCYQFGGVSLIRTFLFFDV